MTMQTYDPAHSPRVADLTKTFEANGKGYRCTAEVLSLLDQIMPMAREANDFSAVTAVMVLGERSGQIAEMTSGEMLGLQMVADACQRAERRGVTDMDGYRALIPFNLGYDAEKLLSDTEIRTVRRIREAIEVRVSQEPKRPLPGDVVIMVGPKTTYDSGRIDAPASWSEHDFALCTRPMTPFIGENGATDTSGGYWRGAEASELEYVGEQTAHFWTWGRHGRCANGGVNFPARVNVWRYQHPDVY